VTGGALHVVPAPAAIEPEAVVRALSGISDAVLASMTALAERCAESERDLAILRGASSLPNGERDALNGRIRDLESRLEGEARLSNLGAMAGGIAHEIRNPLHAARGFAELLVRHATRDGHERRWAARVVEAVDEVEEIATSLLSIASRKPLARDAVEPEELAAGAIASARRVLDGRGKADRWIITNNVDCPRFTGDRIKLRTAVRNLVANALQAIPDGGRVDVCTKLAGGEIEIAVHDSGSGVPTHLRRRLDEPFFTTKCDGTGLGLVLVRAIVELHGGRFEVSESPGPLGGASTLLRIPFEPR